MYVASIDEIWMGLQVMMWIGFRTRKLLSDRTTHLTISRSSLLRASKTFTYMNCSSRKKSSKAYNKHMNSSHYSNFSDIVLEKSRPQTIMKTIEKLVLFSVRSDTKLLHVCNGDENTFAKPGCRSDSCQTLWNSVGTKNSNKCTLFLKLCNARRS